MKKIDIDREDGGSVRSGSLGTRFVPKKTSSKLGLLGLAIAIGTLIYLYA